MCVALLPLGVHVHRSSVSELLPPLAPRTRVTSVPDGNPRCLKQASALIPELAEYCHFQGTKAPWRACALSMESEHRIHGEFGIPTSCVEPEPGRRLNPLATGRVPTELKLLNPAHQVTVQQLSPGAAGGWPQQAGGARAGPGQRLRGARPHGPSARPARPAGGPRAGPARPAPRHIPSGAGPGGAQRRRGMAGRRGGASRSHLRLE